MLKVPVAAATRLATIVGLILATLLLSPSAARAQSTQEGKFSAPVNGRANIYRNGTSLSQTILATVCVNTTGSQSAVLEVLNGGVVVDTLVTLRFGQCRSISTELAVDNTLSIRATTSVSIAGTYILSLQLP
jgi:hypothetical protein